MNNLELAMLGIQEMNTNEMKKLNGGSGSTRIIIDELITGMGIAAELAWLLTGVIVTLRDPYVKKYIRFLKMPSLWRG